MIVFNLVSFQFMCDNKTLNWHTKQLTINSPIDFLYLTITYYPDQRYKPKQTKKTNINPTLLYNYKKLLDYWNTTIKDYSKALNINFEILELNTDYLLLPLYITETTLYIGIVLLKIELIKSIKSTTIISNSFLSSIKTYQCKNKVNCGKYNFINGILNKDNSNSNSNSKEFILDTNKKIPLNHILQNSINYIPNLEIIRIKKNFQSRLNP